MDVVVTQTACVATIEINRPPENFLDATLVGEIATSLENLDETESCRAILLASSGKHFSAGANLGQRLAQGRADGKSSPRGRHIYQEAARIFDSRKPIIAVMQGAAVGAGLGIALLADFRIATPQSRLSANFARQGLHPGMGTTFTLPRLVGPQKASWLLYSGERIGGEEALAIGLVDWLAPEAELRERAFERAVEIGSSAPLAVQSLRKTLRRDMREEFVAAIAREYFEQSWLRETEDYKEGVTAMKERRLPVFNGR
jgi:enoyl-CoA hydratase/carnithine racemase